MGEQTKIPWCDHTFNPWVGCTKVSPGCKFCYAETDMDKRRHYAKWSDHGTRVMTSDSNWKKPFQWNRKAEKEGRKRVVFCASLSDVFEDWIGPITNKDGQEIRYCQSCGCFPSESGNCRNCGHRTQKATMGRIRQRLFYNVIMETPHLIWRILTKRPENIRKFWPVQPDFSMHWDNVQLYTSVENQEQAEIRIPELLKCRDLVPILGISAEPLLEQIDLRPWLHPPMIQHVIVGGESGFDARPFCSDWAHILLMQCYHAKIPFFMKQFGSNAHDGDHPEINRIPFSDKKGGDMDEWTERFRVRQLPEGWEY